MSRPPASSSAALRTPPPQRASGGPEPQRERHADTDEALNDILNWEAPSASQPQRPPDKTRILRGSDPIKARAARASGIFTGVEATQRDGRADRQHGWVEYPIDPEFEWMGKSRRTNKDNQAVQRKTPEPGSTGVAERRGPPRRQSGELAQQVLRTMAGNSDGQDRA